MAVTEAGALMTQAHATAQANLSRAAMADLLDLWPLLDPEDIDGSEVRWLRATVQLIQERQRISAELALRYLLGFRGVELGTTEGFTPGVARLLPVDQITTALRVTGPATVKRLTGEGYTPVKAAETALTRALGAGSRLVQLGGRNALTDGVQADPTALGYQRVARAGACAFCALLAGRGPVYKSLATAGGEGGHRYHDHCHCTAEPIYSRRSALPPTSEAYAEAYKRASGGTLQEKLASMRQDLGSH